MLRRFFFAFVLLAATSDAATVHIVLDASATMRQPLADRKERMKMVSDLVITMLSLIPPEADIKFGVRVFGSSYPMTSPATCHDTVLLHPIAPLQENQSIELLQSLTPGGGAPLALAIEMAGHDLEESDGPQLLIAITDGDDSCGGDLEGAVEALKEQFPELRLHFIGISLDDKTKKRFEAMADTSTAITSQSLVKALITAIGEDVPLAKDPRPVTIELMPENLVARYEKAELKSAVFASSEVLEITDSTLNGLVTSGVYTLLLSGEIPDLEISPIILRNDRDNTFTFTLPNFDDATLKIITENPESGGDIEIEYQGVSSGSFLTLVAREFTAHTIHAPGLFDSEIGAIHLRTPPIPTYYEARLHVPLNETHNAIVARTPFVTLPPSPWIEVPEGLIPIEVQSPTQKGAKKDEIEISIIQTLETNQGIEVIWKGPEAPRDFLGFAPAGAPPETVLNPSFVSESSIIDMWAPNDACEYELRYISPDFGIIVDRLAIRVVEPEAVLEAPDTAVIGSKISIRWIGPDAFTDYITIVTPETPDGEYSIWQTTETGNPLLFSAPKQPGVYEIRYMSGHDKRVLDRIPIEITGIMVELHGPETVKAGRRFSVHWKGPDASGDFIVVAPEGAGPRHHLDFTFTSLGSPASFAAPFRAGDFEIRYISGADGSVLGSVRLTVQ